MSTAPIQDRPDLAIAIVGMACRFPDASGLDEFWANLVAGRESVRPSTDEELRRAGIPAELRENPDFVSCYGRLEGIERFDAQFFGITPRIAEVTSPQQRLLLETAQLALEDAGCYAAAFDGRIGIYCAVESGDYFQENLRGHPVILDRVGLKAVQFATDPAFSATQVAYRLGLTGPAINLTTACSSSLVAVHMACRSLLSYEADLMLAGGAAYSVRHKGYLFQEGGIGSRDGHCRAFDASADGTVSGNGAGMIALKRLEDALRDGDAVYAVILASAINNDGNDKVSYSAPGSRGQASVIREALNIAGVSARAVSYVEAHGTGTSLGDPVEVAALTAAFRELTPAVGFCGLGSVKSNIGHLGCAAGVAAIIKVALSLHHGKLPPTLHVTSPNPALNLDTSPFYLNTSVRDWDGSSRLAGVSSFGMGGTNAHAILRSWPGSARAPLPRSAHVLPISASTSGALSKNVGALCAFLEKNPSVDLADVAYTLQAGRMPRDHRLAVTAKDSNDAVKLLRVVVPRADRSRMAPPRVVMMFPGQGNQYPSMARALLDEDPVFRQVFQECCTYLRQEHALDLPRLLFGAASDEEKQATLRQTRYAQIALFVVEYSLAKALERYGVTPSAMIGHSIGEYVAATLAGVFTLYEAMDVVLARGALMQALPDGAMAAVRLSEEEVRSRLPAELSVAAVNHRAQTVVSGPVPAVERFVRNLGEQGISARMLDVSHAFHSGMMEPCVAQFRSCVERFELKVPKIPFVSNVTGDWITAQQATDPAYWAEHLRSCVRFRDGILLLARETDSVFVEVGPGRSIRQVFRQEEGAGTLSVYSCMSGSGPTTNEPRAFGEALAGVWQNGVQVDWSAGHTKDSGRRVHLPGYAFDRQKHWIDPAVAETAPAPPQPADGTRRAGGQRSQLGDAEDSASLHVPVWHPERLANPGVAVPSKTWVLFAKEADVLAGLRARLEQEGQQVIEVRDGNAFTRTAVDRFEIAFADPLAYVRVLDSIAGAAPELFVYCPDSDPANGSGAGEDTAAYFHNLVSLHSAIRKLRRTTATLICLGRSGALITGQETVQPGCHMAAILCRCLQQAYPEIRSLYADVAAGSGALDSAEAGREWASCIINEWRHHFPKDELAYRGGLRYVRGYAALEERAAGEAAGPFKKGGTYLVTGGWSGIGFEIARHLARDHAARLVIVSRSAPVFPEQLQSRWPSVPIDRSSQEKLEELTRTGAGLLSLPLDVADESALAAALDLARERWGRIDGVIHAAGLPGGGVLELKSRENVESTFAPKVRGSVNLLRYFRDRQPDFILLFSSQNALKGGALRADYSAANAYMDGLACRFASEGAPVTSINWCAWKGTGMLHRLLSSTPLQSAHHGSAKGLSVSEGVALLDVLSHARHPQVVVCKGSGFRIGSDASAQVPQDPLTRVVPEEVAPGSPGIAGTIEEIWKGVLGLERIGVDDNFFELGGDSLASLQIMSHLRREYGVELSLRDFVEQPTIGALQECILRRKVEAQDLDELYQVINEIELGHEDAIVAGWSRPSEPAANERETR